ncbi:zinc metalloprotease HtpX [Rugosimonospora acidiphila]|uniref:Zinc metalloprotease HtpX n=1 Tax=Rugosimonospora acidiphila TaxID=556531 RepID=A0ABP9SHA8_9ACTN
MTVSGQPASPIAGPPGVAVPAPAHRPAPAARPRWRPFSQRPAGYRTAGWWLVAGITRDWRGTVAALIAAWFNLPLAILLGATVAVVAGLAGAVGGAVVASEYLQRIPVFGEVLSHLAVRSGGGIGALAGLFVGALGGGVGGLVLPWLFDYLDDPFVTGVLLLLNVVFGIVIGLLYTLYGIAFEPWRLKLSGARVMSRREARLLLPILHECAQRLGLPNVPRLLIDDSQDVNALAYTRHIVLRQGLLTVFEYDREAIAGVLSHELTHWHNADGVARLLVRGVALPLYLAYAGATWLLRVFENPIIRFAALTVGWPVLLAVRYFVVPMQMASSRAAEYRADQGAVRAGHLTGIRYVLEERKGTFDGSRNGWDEAICASHPPLEHRLERLEARGVDYPLAPGEVEA